MSVLDIRGTLADWQNTIDAAAMAVSGDVLSLPDTNRLRTLMQDTLDALDGVKAAQEAIGPIMNDPNLSGRGKFDQAANGHDAAVQKAQAAINTLDDFRRRLQARVSATWTAAKPSGVSEALLLERKRDLELTLEAAGGDDKSIRVEAATLFREALTALERDKGDSDAALTAFVLAGQPSPLALFYRRQGVDMTALQKVFSEVVSGSAAAGGLAALLGTGENTLGGFLQGARQQLAASIEAVRETLNSLVSALGSYTPTDSRPGTWYRG